MCATSQKNITYLYDDRINDKISNKLKSAKMIILSVALDIRITEWTQSGAATGFQSEEGRDFFRNKTFSEISNKSHEKRNKTQ